jgi:hypothetical protein
MKRLKNPHRNVDCNNPELRRRAGRFGVRWMHIGSTSGSDGKDSRIEEKDHE